MQIDLNVGLCVLRSFCMLYWETHIDRDTMGVSWGEREEREKGDTLIEKNSLQVYIKSCVELGSCQQICVSWVH